jgi:hypothetical protein
MLIFLFQTPLHHAAQGGRGNAAKILGSYGASINEKNVQLLNRTLIACLRNRAETEERK